MKLYHPNITQKFIAYVMFLSVIPLLVVGFIAYRNSADVLKAESERSTNQLVYNQRDYLDLQLKQLANLITNVSGVDAIRNVLDNPPADTGNAYINLSTQARIGYILSGYTNLNGLVSIDIFTVTGAHYHVGDTLDVQNTREDVKTAIFDAATRRAAPNTWIGIVDNVNASSTSKQVITAARATYKINQKTLQQVPNALFLVSYSAQEFYDHFHQIDLGEGGYLLVIDSDGRLVYHPDPSMVGKPADPWLLQALPATEGTITNKVIDQPDISISYITSDFSQLKIVSLIPVSTFNAQAATIGRTIMAAMLAVFALVAFVGWIYSRSVVTPIRAITERFKQLGSVPADLQQRLVVHSNDEVGDLVKWFNTYLDILVLRQRTEEALHDSEEKLRRITDNMLDIICQVDTEGHIEYASPSCWNILGYDSQQLLGKSIYTWVDPQDIPIVKDAIQNTGRVEYRYRHANGIYLWLETLSNLLFDASGSVSGVIFATRDITRRKQAERELQELNTLKTEFLSTAAHELRTPLVSIQGFSELLLTRQLDASRQKHFLDLINDQAVQLGKLVNDLLDISRLEAKRSLTLTFETIDMTDLISNVIVPFAESASSHHFEIADMTGCPSVTGDRFRLAQVCKNLLSNAVKYSPNGGVITIRGQTIPGHVEIIVQDQGVGMTLEQQSHLFEKFYRVDASNTSVGGTGLGLAISKLIVELHGGKIWAQSESGVGTAVHFTLPLASEQIALSNVACQEPVKYS